MQEANKVFTVTELNEIISDILQSTFKSITIEGEVASTKKSGTGHLYFNLIDSTSSISVAVFKSTLAGVTFPITNGDKVVISGRLNVYVKTGNYQIIAYKITKKGEGDALQRIEELKERLNKEGLFLPEHKKQLPVFPLVVGVVTSAEGAAIHDIVRVIKARNKCVSILLYPCLVQGESAATSIIKSIKRANIDKIADVLIVGRGGGSTADLLCFSDEKVVRAVYESSIPVVSAVGHEIDYALIDFVSDRRAATPSNAAEICVPVLEEVKEGIQEVLQNLYNNVKVKLDNYALSLQAVDISKFEASIRLLWEPLALECDKVTEEIKEAIMQRLKEASFAFNTEVQTLNVLSPSSVLLRGYSIVKDTKTQEVIKDKDAVKDKESLVITAANGEYNAIVAL